LSPNRKAAQPDHQAPSYDHAMAVRSTRLYLLQRAAEPRTEAQQTAKMRRKTARSSVLADDLVVRRADRDLLLWVHHAKPM
jgi:hypothetical protein